jgi:hypothetical protein
MQYLTKDNYYSICQYLTLIDIRSYKCVNITVTSQLKDILAAEEHVQTVMNYGKILTMTYRQYKYLIVDKFAPIFLAFEINHNGINHKYICNIENISGRLAVSYSMYNKAADNYITVYGRNRSIDTYPNVYIFVNGDGMAKYLVYEGGIIENISVRRSPGYKPLINIIHEYMCNATYYEHSLVMDIYISNELYNRGRDDLRNINILRQCAELIPRI